MTPSTYLVITAEYDGQEAVLRLEGELDVCNKDQLCSAISTAMEHDPSLLVIDLSALGFMDCGGLSVLARARERLAGRQRRLLLTGCQPSVRRLICLVRPDMICP
jgi:anti-sigma B factor antagonist